MVAWFPVTDLAGLPSDVAQAGGVPDPGPDPARLGSSAPRPSVPDLARQASPVTHASAAAPPVLLMHGAADDLVPPAQSIRLAGALTRAGATVELELVPGATHFWKGASDVAGIVRRSVGFLRAVTPGAGDADYGGTAAVHDGERVLQHPGQLGGIADRHPVGAAGGLATPGRSGRGRS